MKNKGKGNINNSNTHVLVRWFWETENKLGCRGVF